MFRFSILFARRLNKTNAVLSASLPNHHRSSHWHFVKHFACTQISQFSNAEQKLAPPTVSNALHFLQTSCDISEKAAFNVIKKLKSINNVESVIETLKQFSFSNADIVELINRYPAILNSNAEKNLKPKLEFCQRIGIPTRSISLNPQLFCVGLQSRLIPNFELIKSNLPNNKERMKLLKYYPMVLQRNLEKEMIPRINELIEYGASEPVITTLIVQHARQFFHRNHSFEEAFNEIKQMGISPSSSTFARALGVFMQMTKGLREKKLNNYKDLGWSRDQVIRAFTRHPGCLGISDEKTRRNAQFFKEKLDWGAERLSVHPSLLCYSLEKRIIPRLATWRILVSRRLIEDKTPPAKYFFISEEKFTTEYVIRFQDETPELLDVLKKAMQDKKQNKKPL